MTVGAVSSYSSAVQYQYFGAVTSGASIQDLMSKYGIQATGDSATDLKALYEAMYTEASATASQSSPKQSTESQETNSQNSSNVSWATLMSQVGLSATGNLATDYSTFKDKIATMQVSATSQQEKASINQLEAEASIVFVQKDQSATQGSSDSSASGADIQAALNKLYFLG